MLIQIDSWGCKGRAWPEDLLPKKAVTCLGSSLPSHRAWTRDIETKARRAAARNTTFMLPEATVQ